jgi:glycosyltransferase involved in cell wall biosynthesis
MPSALVDLVIPVYNEEVVLERSVDTLQKHLEAAVDFPWRIVIVNNGSIDRTRQIGERLAAGRDRIQFLHLDEKGRGRALTAAWMQTDAAFSLYMDVDLSTELAAIPRAVEVLAAGADIVTGSRLDPRSQIVRSLKREILSQGYNRLIHWTLRTRSFDDAQCGFKGVRLQTIRPLLPLVRNRNWFFDTELLVLAELAGLTIRTIPIRWDEDADTRVNIPRTVLEDLKGLARLWWTARPLVRQWQADRGQVE